MSFSADEVRELADRFPDSEQADKAGVTYFRIPTVELPDGCTPSPMTLLLRPSAIGNYAYRLYFPQQVATPAKKNWVETAHVLGQTRHSFSWQATEKVTLVQMVARLLRALACP